MDEIVGVSILVLVLGALLWLARRHPAIAPTTAGSTPPIADNLSNAVDPEDLSAGPSYFIANQPYYFAPPVGNMMPIGAASRTIATNTIDPDQSSACGCRG